MSPYTISRSSQLGLVTNAKQPSEHEIAYLVVRKDQTDHAKISHLFLRSLKRQTQKERQIIKKNAIYMCRLLGPS